MDLARTSLSGSDATRCAELKTGAEFLEGWPSPGSSAGMALSSRFGADREALMGPGGRGLSKFGGSDTTSIEDVFEARELLPSGLLVRTLRDRGALAWVNAGGVVSFTFVREAPGSGSKV